MQFSFDRMDSRSPGRIFRFYGIRSPDRSPSWLDVEILDLLREKGCSLCIADVDAHPTDEIISTASWGYLRLRRSDYTAAELSQWKEKILLQEWERAFVFFKHEEEAKVPEMAIRFRELTDSRIKKIKTGRRVE